MSEEKAKTRRFCNRSATYFKLSLQVRYWFTAKALFLEKNLRHFSSTKEDFFKELFLDKRVTLPLKCRQGQLARRNRREFAKEMFLSYKQLFSSSLFEVRTTASGFGVFAKQAISIKQGELLAPQELSGTLEVCRDDEFSQLRSDSLFQRPPNARHRDWTLEFGQPQLLLALLVRA